MAPPNSSIFSVSVVLPASGCEMIAKVRRRATGFVSAIESGLSGGRPRLLNARGGEGEGLASWVGRFTLVVPHVRRMTQADRCVIMAAVCITEFCHDLSSECRAQRASRSAGGRPQAARAVRGWRLADGGDTRRPCAPNRRASGRPRAGDRASIYGE